MELLSLTPGTRESLTGLPAQVGSIHFPAGTVLPPTTHEQDEITFIHSGELRAVSGGHGATLQAGDVSFIPAGEVHSAEVVEDVTLSYVLLAVR